MSAKAIIESGMTFGPYPDGHCFYIEKGPTLKKINKRAKKGEGIAIAEFLLLETKGNQITLSIVEAKTSSPRQTNQENFDSYIHEIKEKLANSLACFIAIYLQRHPENNSELPDYFKQLEVSSVNFLLILVIKTSKDEWLPPLQDRLKKALKPTIKIWNLSPTSVLVLNEEGAKRRGFVR